MAFWCHILISGEGTTDAPASVTPLAESRDVGLIEAFTDTLLRHLCAAEYQEPEYTSLPARSLNLRVRGLRPETRYAALLRLAMVHADQLGCGAVVYVVDSREERRDNDQIQALRTVRQEVVGHWQEWHSEGLVAEAQPAPVALGTAIHEIEAWLLADGDQAVTVLHKLNAGEFPNKAAEGMGDPKEDAKCPDEDAKRGWRPLFRRHCRRSRKKLSEAEARVLVARAVRPAILRTRCPCGYAPFMGEIQEYILPLACPQRRGRRRG
jgi:hypothetical protein